MISDRPDLNLNAVVYATDFSSCSRNAGFYAALLAKYFSARLLVAHVFILSQAAMEAEIEHLASSQQRKNLASLLAGEAAALRRYSIEAVPVLLEGEPKKVLPHLAEEHAPSLIVLGTHGGNWIGRDLVGSVAEEVLRSTRWPCLTVGPQVRSAASLASVPFRRILYATDLTPTAARAAVYAVSFAEALGAKIDILHVIAERDIDHPEKLHDLEKHFYDALDCLIPQNAKDFCDPVTFVEAGKARDRIIHHIRERSIDLLVLGTQRDSHLGLILHAGTFRLMVSAPCPVLTLSS